MREPDEIIHEKQLTLFSEASLNDPAKTCPKQENKSGLQAQEAVSGLKCSGLSANSDPVMSLLRTCVEQSISPSIPCTPVWSEKVTKSGLTLYLHLRLVRPTKEKGCLLSESGKMWPTPTLNGNHNRKGLSERSGDGLATAVKTVGSLCPTPREFMYKDSATDRNKGNIGEKVGGHLNPDWVEQLMNFPEGWTDLDVDEPKPWAGWPALLGQEQYPYEFPRITTGCKDRAKRLKALGNAVVPAQAYPFFKAIAEIEKINLGEVIP